ncbi:MAG: WG repeat-containing protein [Deltaproteobacteria bacterium]|nr:WG repeat-containing protein [Deltaproteobacteria bacterium]
MTGRYSFTVILAMVVVALGCSTARHQALYPFERDGKWGYRDEDNTVVIAPRYVVAGAFSPEGIAAVADETSWAYINERGNIVIRPFIYDNGPDYFREGLARYQSAGKLGFFDKSGCVVIPAQFDFALPFHEGLAAYCVGCTCASAGEHKMMQGGKWGFMDRSGETVILPRFDAARSFSEGLAAVRMGKRWGYISKKGEFAIEPKFENALDFKNQRALVAYGGQWLQIDTQGKMTHCSRDAVELHER